MIPPYGGAHDWRIVFTGLFSDDYFKTHQGEFFQSAKALTRANLRIMGVMYLLLVGVAVTLCQILRRYGRVREWSIGLKYGRQILATIVLPRVSEWHLLLSDMMLRESGLRVWVDVLSKGDVLYRGVLNDKILGPDGALVSISVSEPDKFRRADYLGAVKKAQKKAEEAGETFSKEMRPSPDTYWQRIPGEFFFILASDITTINVRHVPATMETWKELKAFKLVLSELARRLKQVEANPDLLSELKLSTKKQKKS